MVLGPEHPDLARILNSKAILSQAQVEIGTLTVKIFGRRSSFEMTIVGMILFTSRDSC